MNIRGAEVTINQMIVFTGCLIAAILLLFASLQVFNAAKPNSGVTISAPQTVKTTPQSPPIPASLTLAVPFTPQAPFAVWDNFHEEACEEAAMLMAAHYLNGEAAGLLDPTAVDAELHQEVDWETANSLPQDLTAVQAIRVMNDFYHINTVSTSTNVTADTIKVELAKGNLVILPAAGRELHNPDFTPPGPWYHYILVKGYDADGNFIVNDAGIKQGNGWKYTASVLLAANHDWAGQNELIDQGQKVMIVVGKG